MRWVCKDEAGLDDIHAANEACIKLEGVLTWLRDTETELGALSTTVKQQEVQLLKQAEKYAHCDARNDP